MKRTLFFTILLTLGLIASQLLPQVSGPLPDWFMHLSRFLTMSLLAYIMIEVGREFEIAKNERHQLAVDYGVAATAATLPWLFCSLYFLMFLMPEQTATGRPPWAEALLVGRFAAPTSAGVLFSMLAAAGLAGTWVYRKTRILAIFDDLDTVLLMIPLQILFIGMVWQLGGLLAIIGALLFIGWRYFRSLSWPTSWQWIISYSLLLNAASELLHFATTNQETSASLHVEILLPAFLLGCALKPHNANVVIPGEDEPGLSTEEKVGIGVSAAFMFLVGMSMPAIWGRESEFELGMSPGILAVHVLVVTLISNLGKMFAVFCYRKQASFKERLAVSVALFPRGEVGAGVLAVSLGYGVNGPFVAVAFLSLALNLILTGAFIIVAKMLIASESRESASAKKRRAYAHQY